MKDSHLCIGLAHQAKIRILACDSTSLVEKARLVHDLYPTSAAALGRVLSATALMGAMLKDEDEKLVVTINGGGPIGTIMTEAYGPYLKGLVGDNTIYLKYNDSNKLAVGLAVGKGGYLKVSRNMHLKETFTSQVALQTGEIGDDFAYYFALSEQVPSLVSLGVLVDVDTHIKAAGGLIIQLMPGHNEEDIQYVEELAKDLKPISSVIAEGKGPEEYIKELFKDAEIVLRKDIDYHCDCSKERFISSLLALPKDDLNEVLKDETIEVKCEFCNKVYKIKKEEIEKCYENVED